jgi:predicted amidohydrolase YtcJ
MSRYRPVRTSLVVALAVGLTGACTGGESAPARSTAESPTATTAAATDGSGITVVANAAVYTVDGSNPTAEAFAYDARGTIIAVGRTADVLGAAGDDAIVIDAGGRMVLPGFQDAHVHVPEAGINEGLCLLDPGLSLVDYEVLLRECADEQPDSDWVRAAGASLFDLRASDELPIDVLDRAIPDRPALVLDDLGHAAWTNTLGLEAAGIGADDPNPQGGVLHRDPTSGELTGLLLENAQQPVRNAAAVDADVVYDGLLVALDQLAENGITSISDAGGYWQQGHSAAFEQALDDESLTVRGSNALYLYPDMDIDDQLAEFKRRLSNDPNSLLRFDTVKIYVDGILDLGTAAMLDPYVDPPDPEYPNGFFYFGAAELQRYVTELHAMGYRLSFHAIGDAAVRTALDAIEAIDDEPANIAGRRHRITHTYLVDSADLDRFATLGVVADFQVGPESSATDYHEYLSDYIGDQAFDLIPLKTVLETGAHVSLSSDWDADPLSPFGTMQRAVLRDENAVDTVEQAIELLTLGAAYALGQDDSTGSIEVGKQADYVMIDQQLLEIEPERIENTRVLLTVVGGNETFRADDFDAEP